MRTIPLAAAIVLIPVTAWAWGQEGHSIIGEIAQRKLGTDARSAVDRLLGHGTLPSIASWADDVKFTDRPDTKPWHFVDIPVAQQKYDPMRDCKDPATGKDNVCIIAALESLKSDMRCGKDDKAKLDALRFVVHLVGDITQPLHTVLEGDGANNFKVAIKFCGLKYSGTHCTPDGRLVVFHEVWDSTLITETVYDWGAYVERLSKDDGWLNSDEARKWDIDGGSYEDWANDAHSYAPIIWTKLLRADNIVDDSYYKKVLPILDRQLGIGGLRLARVLNEAFAVSSNRCPAKER
jgi:hypothetical protein